MGRISYFGSVFISHGNVYYEWWICITINIYSISVRVIDHL